MIYSGRMVNHGWPLLAISAFLGMPCLLGAQPVTTADQALSILKQNCASCHGASQQMSGYDLRTREAGLRGGSKGVAIVPGKSGSEHAGRTPDRSHPASHASRRKLKDSDIAIIRQWIDQGAHWPDGRSGFRRRFRSTAACEIGRDRNWWAFRKPVRRDRRL